MINTGPEPGEREECTERTKFLSRKANRQARSPIRNEGYGLASALDARDPAFIGCEPLEFARAVQASAGPEPHGHLQRFLELPTARNITDEMTKIERVCEAESRRGSGYLLGCTSAEHGGPVNGGKGSLRMESGAESRGGSRPSNERERTWEDPVRKRLG